MGSKGNVQSAAVLARPDGTERIGHQQKALSVIINGLLYSYIDCQSEFVLGESDQAAYARIVSDADARGVPVWLNGRTFNLTLNADAPRHGFIGPGSVLGAEVRVHRNRQQFYVRGKVVFDTLHISGAHYLRGEHIVCNTVMRLDGGTDTGQELFGAFWNHFGFVEGDIKIDTSFQSVNLNQFEFVRGTIHVYGGHTQKLDINGNVIANECDKNVFHVVDSSYRSVVATDGTTGKWAVLNEAANKQVNKIGTWYSEGSASGNNAISGPWVREGGYFDGPSSPYALPEYIHVLNSGPNANRASRDFFAGNPQANFAVGGLWDVLDFDNGARPTCMGSAVMAGAVRAETADPSGIGYSYGGTSAASFAAININLKHSKTGYYGIFFFAYMPQGHAGIYLARGADTDNLVSKSDGAFHDYGNGWRLYRISGFCRNDGQDEQLVIYFNTTGTVSREIRISGVWASPEHVSFLPTRVPRNQICGIATKTPTGQFDWAPVGTVITNQNASPFGAAYGWVKHDATLYGALRSSEPFRGSGQVSVPVDTKTEVFRFTVGGYNTALSGDIDLYLDMASASPNFRDGAGKAKLLFAARKNSDELSYTATLETAAYPWVASGSLAAPVITLEVVGSDYILYCNPPLLGGVITVNYVVTSNKMITLA